MLTVIFPELAPEGTVAIILLPDVTDTVVPVTPPNFTVMAFKLEPKLVPVISMFLPGSWLVGLKLEIVG